MAKCIECGFLAIQNRRTDEVVEVHAGLRAELARVGYITHSPTCDLGPPYPEWPFCVQSHALEPEGRSVRVFLTAERRCQDFLEWHPSLSPKDHQAMKMHKEEMEGMNRLQKIMIAVLCVQTLVGCASIGASVWLARTVQAPVAAPVTVNVPDIKPVISVIVVTPAPAPTSTPSSTPTP